MKNKFINLIKNNKRWVMFFVCIVIFVDVLENMLDYEIINFDTIIFNAVKNIRTYTNTNIVKVITSFGGAFILTVISALAFIFIKNKKIGIMIILNLATIGALNQILKHIIQRPRPIENRLIEESGYSFPSGHSMASTAFYGLIIYFIFKYVKNNILKTILCTLLIIFIFLIGISRIYLGVHYASDVIAGFVISIAYLSVFTSIVPKIMEKE